MTRRTLSPSQFRSIIDELYTDSSRELLRAQALTERLAERHHHKELQPVLERELVLAF